MPKPPRYTIAARPAASEREVDECLSTARRILHQKPFMWNELHDAFKALGQTRHEKAAAFLSDIVTDDHLTRTKANAGPAAHLTNIADKNDVEVAALDTLSRMGHPRAVAAYVHRFYDAKSDMRVHAQTGWYNALANDREQTVQQLTELILRPFTPGCPGNQQLRALSLADSAASLAPDTLNDKQVKHVLDAIALDRLADKQAQVVHHLLHRYPTDPALIPSIARFAPLGSHAPKIMGVEFEFHRTPFRALVTLGKQVKNPNATTTPLAQRNAALVAHLVQPEIDPPAAMHKLVETVFTPATRKRFRTIPQWKVYYGQLRDAANNTRTK